YSSHPSQKSGHPVYFTHPPPPSPNRNLPRAPRLHSLRRLSRLDHPAHSRTLQPLNAAYQRSSSIFSFLFRIFPLLPIFPIIPNTHRISLISDLNQTQLWKELVRCGRTGVWTLPSLTSSKQPISKVP